GRRAGGDDVAGSQRDAGGQRLDQRRYVEDERARVGVLAQFPIDPAAHRRVGEIDFFAADRERPHGAEAVLRLADQPLLVPTLQVTGGDVVDDGVAPDVLQRPGARDGAATTADDDRKFRLVVDGLGDGR